MRLLLLMSLRAMESATGFEVPKSTPAPERPASEQHFMEPEERPAHGDA